METFEIRAGTSVILAGKRDSRRPSTTSFSGRKKLSNIFYFAIGAGLNFLQQK